MKKTLIVAVVLALAPGPVVAGSEGWEYPRETQIRNGRMLVDVGNIDMEGKPSCANDSRWEFVVTDPGQQQFVREQALRGNYFYWLGSGECDNGAETVKSVYVCLNNCF